MKKVRLDTLKQGSCFRYWGILYMVTDEASQVKLTGVNRGFLMHYRSNPNVIPVLVTIMETI